jgi:hypothetical protein
MTNDEGGARSLTRRFFEEIRKVNLGERETVNFKVEDLATIAGDITLLTEFCLEFSRFSQDPDARLLIIEIVRKLATSEEGAVMRYDANIDTIDRYPARVCAGAVIGGMGALLYGAVAVGSIPVLGPAVLVVAGLVGLSACVYGRRRLSRDKVAATVSQKHFEQLAARLEKLHASSPGGS